MMPAEFEFDVFISYSSRDKAWVRSELLTRIEQAGLKAFIDFRDFTRGASSIKEMERGVTRCRKTLLVLTPNYIKSGWCEIENMMLQILDPSNRQHRLIPILKIECDKPLHIAALTHIDFTHNADHQLAWGQLLTALGKPPEPPPPKEPERNDWFLAHPYPMPPNFTGRLDERNMLTNWLEADAAHPLLSLRALGGFGKSALAWHWLTHDVKLADWPRVVWWSFYEGDASFDHFLSQTLEYLSGGKIKPDRLSVNEVRSLLKLLETSGTLLVLDGFERVLRVFGGMDAAYRGDEVVTSEGNDRDCISPLTEDFLRRLAALPNIGAKVLLTTRLCPHVLEAKGGGLLLGCREEELKQMQPADAVEFFRARGIRGTRAEIQGACEPYGYHPLSLRLLAGLILTDLQQPGDITAARHLDVSGDLIQRQNHVLKVAYDSLTPERQKLLSRIACFRGSVQYEAMKILTKKTETLDTDVRDLVARGLLHLDTIEGRFDLHPIVRRYAYDRLAEPDRAGAHTRLLDYFAAVPMSERVTRLENLAPVIELYYHTIRAARFARAFTLFHQRLRERLHYQFGAYGLCIDLLRVLFPDGEDHPPSLKDDARHGWLLQAMANSYSLAGQPRLAVQFYRRHAALRIKQGDQRGLAVGLGASASVALLPTGALLSAEANLRQGIALSGKVGDEIVQAAWRNELGRLLTYRGAYSKAKKQLATARETFRRRRATGEGLFPWAGNWGGTMPVQKQCIASAHLALHELLQFRSGSSTRDGHLRCALKAARQSLEYAHETARGQFAYEHDYIYANWLLGAAYRAASDVDQADHCLRDAIERCRRVNCVYREADILIDLARLRVATGELDEAKRLAEEALLITERCGYVLQGADAHLELAKLALGRGEKDTALEHAKEARRLATCDGPPDYTYKVAYDEAGALLAQLGESV